MHRSVTDEERTYFATVLPVHPALVRLGTPGAESTPQVTPQVVASLTNREFQVLAFCITPQDREAILAHLGLRDREHLRIRYLQPLQALGLLALTEPESPRSPTQRYLTTAQGLAVLRSVETV